MQKEIDLFKELASTFKKNGFSLYLVGGTVRDFLLGIEIKDFDLTTDATPDQIKLFLNNGDYTFSHLGFVKYNYKGTSFDITTLRKEEEYQDFRHPNKIVFVKTPNEDFRRRDFTINAMYMDSDLNLIDYVKGKDDLNSKIIRMVGNPDTRIKEDPLRILRAIRFSLTYNFEIDKELVDAIKNNVDLIDRLNKDKIKQEIKKIKNIEKERIQNIFNYFSIQYLLKVVD